jgi:hypothetical protein
MDEYKLTLLKFTQTPISIFEKDYSDAVKLHILQHNFDKNDLLPLLQNYDNYSHTIKQYIDELLVQYKDVIIKQKDAITFPICELVITSNAINEEYKKLFFSMLLPSMNKKQCKEYLNRLQMIDFLELFNNGRPKFEVSDLNKKILQIFKEREWIKNFAIDTETQSQPQYYKVEKR